MTYIDSIAFVLDNPQQRNFERWPVLHEYVWPNNFVGGTYANEIAYLKSWIKDRLSWLDTNIARLELVTALEAKITEDEELVTVYPNPNNGDFYIKFKEFLKAGRRVKLSDQLGQIIIDKYMYINNLTGNTYSFNEILNPGFYVLEIVAKTGTSNTWKIIVH